MQWWPNSVRMRSNLDVLEWHAAATSCVMFLKLGLDDGP